MRKQLTRYPIVDVQWDDAWGSEDKNGTKSKPDKCEPWLKRTVGFLVKRNKKGVLVSQELNEDGAYEYNTFVPKGAITKMRTLKCYAGSK